MCFNAQPTQKIGYVQEYGTIINTCADNDVRAGVCEIDYLLQLGMNDDAVFLIRNNVKVAAALAPRDNRTGPFLVEVVWSPTELTIMVGDRIGPIASELRTDTSDVSAMILRVLRVPLTTLTVLSMPQVPWNSYKSLLFHADTGSIPVGTPN
jgi:hypothetical protein